MQEAGDGCCVWELWGRRTGVLGIWTDETNQEVPRQYKLFLERSSPLTTKILV
jgi:hypothetical protein